MPNLERMLAKLAARYYAWWVRRAFRRMTKRLEQTSKAVRKLSIVFEESSAAIETVAKAWDKLEQKRRGTCK